MSEPWELSCYTANLVAYLRPRAPGIATDLAAAIRLSVRTDPPGGGLAFSHHTRVDIDAGGHGLAYRGADDWERARDALTAELERAGRVLAVGNTRHIPWSPAHERAETPHWVLLSGRFDGTWSVTDDFAALTPHGEHAPHTGLLDDDELRAVLTPLADITPVAADRDRYALGECTALPPATGYRWLEHTALPPRAEEPEGSWIHGVVPALRAVAERVCGHDEALARHADDLWTAARHQRFRLAQHAPGPDAAARAAAATAWEELPRAARFAVASAARGRPRHALVDRAFARLLDTVEQLGDGDHDD
ncbi:hypothetical protein [Streptomyces hygroscopicus]|uniref:hypothetical protein n=1 Tax=Streptomyces hygroscopicus TaxID=1912 RepID=UPI0004C99FB8|nr:hypothetical protein [Streptomyces hygroscopicus]